jgi:hypothetical protein
MKINSSRLLAVAAAAALGGCTQAHSIESGESSVILQWDRILTENLPPAAGLFSFRYYAMMHIAMFDAANSIERSHTPYHVQVPSNPSASAEAAAAQAAHDVLVTLIPAQAATFDAALASRLDAIRPALRAASGAEVGRKVAQAVIDWRTGDGTEQPNIAYMPPEVPGLWQPTPPASAPAAGVQFRNVEPFALPTPTQYLPAAPPLLNSEEYAADFNEVKEVGQANSSARTADQTLQALLFAGPPHYSPGPFTLWSAVARGLASSRAMSITETARLFATMNAALHDGLQTSHTSKFVYGLWRPVTAIQRAAEDHNDATAPDPSWMPLLVTPPYPSHSSNLTCIGVSAARALARDARLRRHRVRRDVDGPERQGQRDEIV